MGIFVLSQKQFSCWPLVLFRNVAGSCFIYSWNLFPNSFKNVFSLTHNLYDLLLEFILFLFNEWLVIHLCILEAVSKLSCHSSRDKRFTLSLVHKTSRILQLLECCFNWSSVMRAGWASAGLQWMLRCWRDSLHTDTHPSPTALEMVVYFISPRLFGISFICVGLERVCACSVFVCLEITDLNWSWVRV